MKTGLLILRCDGSRDDRVVDMTGDPGLAELRDVLEPILGGRLEHVAVLHEGRRADMFVHEDGHGEGLPRNEAATAIYRASWLERHPADPPETLPWIAGPAVVFGRTVWS
ncbi:hypothetical protein MMSR116_29465 [Methylobacterium mesophilicum SR1.6/6]|uniref:Uncharacterized protein n=1 Tax=Methylobacterium mesophilicum SR1.6/6 TaxID=908290 RepID=A0A6B9FV10_9HYPH|nr:hypothetical protein [Methylobacterium mesophilicum]QGY05566.1 hypothetical protein MMSR116_29465 [Methylobacterium mesophilicum SR1.6/6]